ncbi:hypothetical protein [Microlunatus parietis]|uniref:Lipoprotein n=1 Tax=Microlunatus parietis TaxID=682979 RepID=A0A7Y9IBG9_9ACTN|nr:hypothetical protein [Microlunatus parietis]NYE73767.1 hypothetical protein [Microlunatus parietis]
MSTPRRTGVASALAILLFLSACSTPVRINGAEVDSKVPFLSLLEQEWRKERAGEKHASLANETSCWLLREPKTGNLQPRAFCGPIRHLEDAGKPGVFDEMEFEPRLIGDKQVSVDPDDVDPGDTGLEAPEGVELYRPDGRTPVPAEQVPQPQPPAAGSGEIIKYESASFQTGTEPEDAVIKAPGFTFTLNRFGTLDRLGVGGGRRWPLVPADHEEFLAFTVTRLYDPEFNRGRAGTPETYSLRVGEKTTPLEELLGYKKGLFAISEDPVTLVASVPVGAEAELVVGVAGVDQTISLRTGKRTSTTAAAYYRGKTTAGANRQYTPRPATNGDFQLQHSITFTEASVSPFDRDRSWAPKGQMWLYLDWDQRTSQRAGAKANLYRADYDPGDSIRLTGPDKKAIEIVEGNPVSKINSDRDGTIVALVPDSITSITVEYAPQGHFQVTSSYTNSDATPKEGDFKFEPETFTIDLS